MVQQDSVRISRCFWRGKLLSESQDVTSRHENVLQKAIRSKGGALGIKGEMVPVVSNVEEGRDRKGLAMRFLAFFVR